MKMNISLAKIKEVFPNFNITALTENDFWRAAKKYRVIVRRMPLRVKGYYKPHRGRHYIMIDSRLTGLDFLHTALHEFCHFLFDMPEVNEALYSGRDNDTCEQFADAFALAAMIPLPELLNVGYDDLTGNVWLSRIIADRIVIYTRYGI